MNTHYSLIAVSEKSMENHFSDLRFKKESDAHFYKNLFLDHLKSQDNIMIKLAVRWFEVEFLIGTEDSDEPCFNSLSDSLPYLDQDFDDFKEYIEGIIADFLHDQISKNVASPDLTLDIPEGEQPFITTDSPESSTDDETKASNNNTGEGAYFPE